MRRLILDMSSFVWSALLAGRDQENGRDIPLPNRDDGKTVHVASAEFGFDNLCNVLQSKLKRFNAVPRQFVAVFEGENSKQLRTRISPTYKPSKAERVPEMYAEFNRTLDMAKRLLLDLGAICVSQSGLEADDVIAYLAQNLQGERIVCTRDGDMTQLSDPLIDIHTDIDGYELNENKYGPFPSRYTTLYKALVGDSGDGIKGAQGFGPKAFLKLYMAFDTVGLDSMIELIKQHELHRLEEDVAELPELKKILADQEGVYLSWQLASLYPHLVNTMARPLSIQAGVIKDWDAATCEARFKEFYGARRLIHAGNYAEALNWIETKFKESPVVALDIETSTPLESDEWLALKSKATDKDTDNVGVDVLGSKLTGQGLTFGNNGQYSVYFTVDHLPAPGVANCTSEQVRAITAKVSSPLLVQNANFELPILWLEWGEKQAENGFHGFLPNVIDTKMMASYVNENRSSGLKQSSEHYLGYRQTTYMDVTQGRKMNQMTAAETFAYGTDDTICTMALYYRYLFTMELERSVKVFEEVETGAMYLTALQFAVGTPISLEKMKELEKKDDEDYAKAWAVLRAKLFDLNWPGCSYQPYTADAEGVKRAFELVTGKALETRVRKLDRLADAVEEQGDANLAEMIRLGDTANVDAYCKQFFKGEPTLNMDSPPQMQKLLYEDLKLSHRVWNKPTDKRVADGLAQGLKRYEVKGSPKTDDLALRYALMHDTGDEASVAVVKAIQTLKIVSTRRKLYYKPYRYMQHWSDNLVHSSLNQCAAATRRYTSSGPNLQQLPKHPKATGEPARFREVFVPHHKQAVVVSIDFSGQELRLIAERSQDPNMLACFVGDDLKDMHSLTGAGILSNWIRRGYPASGVMTDDAWELAKQLTEGYEGFVAGLAMKPLAAAMKNLRALGKKTNFTTEFGAQAPRLAETLLIAVEEAQGYIDAKYATFARAETWKKEVITSAREVGYTTTLMGARRHLADIYTTGSGFDKGKADRQGVNFEIQGSAAEQSKLAMGRVWRSNVLDRFDATFIAPIHDELVFSVATSELYDFLVEIHASMVAPYSTMTVPVIGSISFGRNFGEQVEIGEVVTREAVNNALFEIFGEERMAA